MRLVRHRQRRQRPAGEGRCDAVEERVHPSGGPKPKRIEGLDTLQWVLMDYGDVIVDIFQQDIREFYDLERLWADVPRIEWADDAA